MVNGSLHSAALVMLRWPGGDSLKLTCVCSGFPSSYEQTWTLTEVGGSCVCMCVHMSVTVDDGGVGLVCECVCECECMCAYRCVCVCVCVRACVRVCMRACVRVCVRACVGGCAWLMCVFVDWQDTHRSSASCFA